MSIHRLQRIRTLCTVRHSSSSSPLASSSLLSAKIVSPFSTVSPLLSSLASGCSASFPISTRSFSSHSHPRTPRHHASTPQPIAWYTSTFDSRTGKLVTVRSDKLYNTENRLHHPNPHSDTTILNGSSPSTPDLTFIFAHATGFCGHVFTPLMENLAKYAHYEKKNVRLLSFDFTGHGNSSHRHPSDPTKWEEYTRSDLLEVLQEANVLPSTGSPSSPASPVIGIGHSFGAVGMILAELHRPRTFHHIFAFEPVIPPSEMMLKWKDNEELPLYKGALRRKFSWKNKDEALQYFLSKSLFQSFHADALQGYMTTGLQAKPDGSMHLACAPNFEAQIYRGYHDGYDRLPSLTSCPVHIVAGGAEPQGLMAFNWKFFHKVADRIPGSEFVKVDGTGHFLVMEKPLECAKVIAQGLKWKTVS